MNDDEYGKNIVQGVFSKGPTQKSSKYEIGPSQQDRTVYLAIGPIPHLELFWLGPFEKNTLY